MISPRRKRRRIDANIPTILIIFGATGDLIGKKILPSLFRLHQQNVLPEKFCTVGVSRRNFTDGAFREYLKNRLAVHSAGKLGKGDAKKFLEQFVYQKGFLGKVGDYRALSRRLKHIDDTWGICTNKLFYLAVPPELYETIFRYLRASGLTIPCGPNEGWTRVIVEKPFGKDQKTAERLDALLGTLFKEEQIYRIDHYLAKEMLQNILTFRFANNLFESQWSNKTIERIEIRLLEKIGVENRGAFYDSVGALRDVGQNHLLQMLALATMENPLSLGVAEIRKKRADLLRQLVPLSEREMRTQTFRAQHDGYRRITGVNPSSKTETYFKIRAHLSSPRWEGVPITLESGKRLGRQQKEIVFHLRRPPGRVHGSESGHKQNRIIIQLEPQEEITVTMLAKKPSLSHELEERRLHFMLRRRSKRSQYTEEYEKLLLDCIAGNQTLFISTDEVKSMWRFTDPITRAWERGIVPLSIYAPDGQAILKQAEQIMDRGVVQFAKKEIGIIGLGKMGANISRSLLEKGWRVVGYNRSPEKTKELEREGIEGAYSLQEFASKLTKPRLVWMMLPAGDATEEILLGKNGLLPHLQTRPSSTTSLKTGVFKDVVRGDIVIDAGNSFYKDSIRREKFLKNRGIKFLDAGVSGGPAGARNGAAIMVGGEKKVYEFVEKLFKDLSIPGGYGYMGSVGAGHFVKMIHNGIEYGMMQAIGEGFEVLKKSAYKLDLKNVARVYSRGTVIESRLISWLGNALDIHGPELKKVSGSVKHTGEGAWTVKTAKEEKVKVKIIEEALKFRIDSEKNPSYTGKVVSALREQFGGHDVKGK